MRKLTPVFFLLAAFFFAALVINVAYDQRSARAVAPPAHLVALEADHADPAQVIIPMGDWVAFVSEDDIAHNLWQVNNDQTADPTGLKSGVFLPNQGYRLRFTKAGAFSFIDQLHPHITVTIIVIDPSK